MGMPDANFFRRLSYRGSLTLRLLLPLLLIVAAMAIAQELPLSYRLGPEDTITVQILGQPELSGEYFISPDGVINFPAVGAVLVSGKTIGEITKLITQKLQGRLRDPEVFINLKLTRMQRVYVLGEVAKPGVFDLKANWRITEALAAAGGSVKLSRDFRVVLLHNDGMRQTFELPDVLRGVPTANPTLVTGDVVTVEPLELDPVYVIGAVKSPGLYELRPGGGAVEALTLAGGLSAPVADVSAVVVRGKQEVAVVNLIAALQQSDPRANTPLQRGDVLLVKPQEMLPVYVIGAVKMPGIYDMPPGSGAVEALTRAGGLLAPVADVSAVVVRGKQEAATVDLVAALQKNDSRANNPLQRGDILLVKPLELLPVYVTGAVARPGLYDIRPGRGVVEAIAQAGGLTLAEQDVHITVIRDAHEVAELNVAAALTKADPQANIAVQRGDVVKVETLFAMPITVSGRVKIPGVYKLRQGDRVMDALSTAGGPLEQAALSRLTIIHRDGTSIVADLARATQQGDLTHNLPLAAGDLVLVPEIISRVAVLGFVGQPGTYTLPDGLAVRLTDVLAMAKGMDNKRGGITKVAVLRMVNNKQERIICDLRQYIAKADLKQNPEIHADDIVYVPETSKPDWDLIFRALSSVGIVYGQVNNTN